MVSLFVLGMKGGIKLEGSQIKVSGFVVQPRLQFKHTRDQMLFQYFLTTASFKETSKLRMGQSIISISDLTRQLGWTRKEIIISLKRLEDAGLINRKARPSNKGILLTIVSYESFQDLKNYKNQGQQNEKEGQQNENKGQLIYITAFINSITNINKTLKEYIADANVKNMNLKSTEDIEIFVDFALRTNALPADTSKKILIAYFDTIRLTRSTCSISAKLLANFIEKLSKYTVNQIHYGLWKHVQQHDDKRESYTLGILRNTTDPEARRGLIILKNKKGADLHAINPMLPTAVGENTSSTRSEAQRLEELAKAKGLTGGTLRDFEFDF